MNELHQEVIKKYPIGTEFICIDCGKKHKVIRHEFYSDSRDIAHLNTRQGVCYPCINRGKGWAKIIKINYEIY